MHHYRNIHRAPENELGKSEAVLPAGSAGYSDATVIVPWRIYRAYGDERILAEQWSSMARWVDRCEHVARTQRHLERIKARPEPAAHERFLIDTGVHFGEWVAPPSNIDQWNPSSRTDVMTATSPPLPSFSDFPRSAVRPIPITVSRSSSLE